MWWRAFRNILQQQPQDCGLLMTEAPFNLPSIQASTMQVTCLAFLEHGLHVSQHCKKVHIVEI